MRKDWLLTCTIAAFVLQAPVFGETVIEIRAVKITDSMGNDVPLAGGPTTTPSVNPGDTVEAELILLPGFGADLPNGIRSAQVVVDGRQGATSGGNDRVLPVGWDAPLDLVACQVLADCPFGFFCDPSLRKCVGTSHLPSAGAFIDSSLARTDFLFHLDVGQDARTLLGTATLGYLFGSLNQSGFSVGDAEDDGSSELYMGTYILEVGDFACGTFTFGGVSSGIGDRSELAGPDILQPSVIPTIVPLLVDTGACGPLPIDSLSCSLDARYPHSPTSASPSFAGKTFELEFDVRPTGLSSGAFAKSTFPVSFPAPIISNINLRGTTATVTMQDQFVENKWTCIRHIATDRSFCRANLPGDSDQNQLVALADIDALLVNLDPPLLGENGEPYVPLSLPACDIDRSSVCTPLDLLGSMNLLIGSGAFAPPWLDEELTFRCPGAPKP